MGLGGVFDDVEIVLLCNGFDGVHISALTIDMDRDDDGGFVGDGLLYAVGVHAVGLWVDVDHDRNATRMNDGFKRGEERMGGDDGFETGFEIEGFDGEREGIGTVGTGKPVVGVAIRCEILLECADVFTEEEAHFVEDVLEFGENLLLDGQVGGMEVNKGDGDVCLSCHEIDPVA